VPAAAIIARMSDFFACVGHASVDHHFEIEAFAANPTKTPAHSYRQIVGGMAANASISMARLGLPVHLIGRVGDDDAGRFIQSAVRELGITSRLEAVQGGHTSVSSVIVDAQGERQIFNHRGDALAKAHPLSTRLLQGAQAVLTDPRWGDGAAAALIWARENGVLGMLDADVAPFEVLQRLVPLAKWAVFSEAGLTCYAPNARTSGAGLIEALDAGAASAMVTLGEKGVAWMHTKQRILHTQASFPVKALDTTGAGDVFHAALCFALSELSPDADASQERQAIRFACAAAALKCTQRHGALGAPTRGEVLRFLDTQPTSSNN
jgi:sulfofructose kinase